mmetsp:Transcript_2089/g.8160  ORF Transcript_2089/g.8160 Transcript_2089/m.8160 type:complete len:225 (+) Transcript_2089:646-1320(+)
MPATRLLLRDATHRARLDTNTTLPNTRHSRRDSRGCPILLHIKLIRRDVHVLHRPARNIPDALLPLRIPAHGFRSGTRDRFAKWARRIRAVTILKSSHKVLLENGAEQVILLRRRRMQREALGASRKVFIRHFELGMRRQTVDPVVADAVAKLFFLSPKHFLRQVGISRGVERLAKDVLFQVRTPIRILLVDINHLVLRSHVHREIDDLLRQERSAHLNAPTHS